VGKKYHERGVKFRVRVKNKRKEDWKKGASKVLIFPGNTNPGHARESYYFIYNA
jgi:hypothetical protein